MGPFQLRIQQSTLITPPKRIFLSSLLINILICCFAQYLKYVPCLISINIFQKNIKNINIFLYVERKLIKSHMNIF